MEMETSKVPQDYKTIQQAIDNSNNGDRVEVSSGLYKGTIDVKNKKIAAIGINFPQIKLKNNDHAIVNMENALTVTGFYFIGEKA